MGVRSGSLPTSNRSKLPVPPSPLTPCVALVRLGGGGRRAGRLARREPAAEHGVGRRRGAGSRDQVGDLSVPAGRINFAAPGRLVELVGEPVPGDLGRHGAQRDRVAYTRICIWVFAGTM